MPSKKPKRMTKREKAMRAAIKKELQAEGCLPPNKPRLNRKKFAAETIKEFNETMTSYTDLIYLRDAVSWMVSEKMSQVSEEEVGVLKMLKLSIEIKRFQEDARESGRSSYNLEELYKILEPFLRL